MKFYKCKVRVTEVRESISIIESPSEKIAKSPSWVIWAEKIHGIEELEEVEKTHEVLSVKEVTKLSQIPKKWHDCIPWYHPQFKSKDERTVEERMSIDKQGDDNHTIDEEIEFLKKQKLKIEDEISKLSSLIIRA